MSDFFEIFNPGARHAREYRDAEKMLMVDTKKSGSGPDPLDLDAGEVILKMPAARSAPEPDVAGIDPGSSSGQDVESSAEPASESSAESSSQPD